MTGTREPGSPVCGGPPNQGGHSRAASGTEHDRAAQFDDLKAKHPGGAPLAAVTGTIGADAAVSAATLGDGVPPAVVKTADGKGARNTQNSGIVPVSSCATLT